MTNVSVIIKTLLYILLQDAWRHMKSCKFTIRPNRSLVKQLALFEEKNLEKSVTDIKDPLF